LVSGGSDPTVQSSAGGLSALVLLPVLAMALYYPRWYSAVVIVAAMVGLTAVGIAVQTSGATNLRRLFLWTAVSVVVAVTVHHLRDTLQGKAKDSAELARLGRLMNGATQSLTSLRDPKDVIAEGTQVMADLAGAGFHRAAYLRVRDGVVLQEAVVDRAGTAPTSYLLRDDPCLEEVIESGQPALRTLARAAMGPTMRSVMDETNATDPTEVACIPITVDDAVHGVVRIESDGAPFSDDVVARCRALGNVVELALGNAIAHQELELQANTDPLTGQANRRGLALFLEGDRGLGALSMLVIDIDGLKEINDTHGHDIGDRVLISVARAASGILRGGDLLARTGGDEFVAVVVDADESDARRVVDRINHAMSRVKVQGVGVSVSIGFASCSTNGDLDRVRRQADEAMYEAKRVNRRAHARHPRTPGDQGGSMAVPKP
jgi:diguanylate cyclase (GGDEF)-like protein